jgi:hypothetical protein
VAFLTTLAKVSDQIVLESLHLGTEDVAAVTQDAEGRLTHGLIDLRTETAQVKERDGHGKMRGA